LIKAAGEGKLDVVQYLVGMKANIEAKSKQGNTPLIIAACKGKLDVVQYLVGMKANIEAKSKQGNTPLIIAACKGKLDVVQYLVGMKANIEAKSKQGNTPLIIAACKGKLDVVQYLVGMKANIEAKCNYGKTASGWAKEKGHSNIVAFLRNAAKVQETSEKAEEKVVQKAEEVQRKLNKAERLLEKAKKEAQEADRKRKESVKRDRDRGSPAESMEKNIKEKYWKKELVEIKQQLALQNKELGSKADAPENMLDCIRGHKLLTLFHRGLYSELIDYYQLSFIVPKGIVELSTDLSTSLIEFAGGISSIFSMIAAGKKYLDDTKKKSDYTKIRAIAKDAFSASQVISKAVNAITLHYTATIQDSNKLKEAVEASGFLERMNEKWNSWLRGKRSVDEEVSNFARCTAAKIVLCILKEGMGVPPGDKDAATRRLCTCAGVEYRNYSQQIVLVAGVKKTAQSSPANGPTTVLSPDKVMTEMLKMQQKMAEMEAERAREKAERAREKAERAREQKEFRALQEKLKSLVPDDDIEHLGDQSGGEQMQIQAQMEKNVLSPRRKGTGQDTLTTAEKEIRLKILEEQVGHLQKDMDRVVMKTFKKKK